MPHDDWPRWKRWLVCSAVGFCSAVVAGLVVAFLAAAALVAWTWVSPETPD